MKKPIALILFLGTAALNFNVHALAASRNDLVAPGYANAKLIKSGLYSATYLTNDSAASVCAFYKRNGISFDKSDVGGCSAELLDSVAICHAQDKAHSQAPTYVSNADKGVTNPPPDTAVIVVTASEVPPRAQSEQMIPFDRYSVFSRLKQEAAMHQGESHSADMASQLLTLYNKYRWINEAFYPPHKSGKGNEPYNHWLMETTAARIGRPMQEAGARAASVSENESAVAERIRKLMAAGKTQEAMQLAQQIQPGITSAQATNRSMGNEYKKDHWNTWMKVLRKLKASAYRSKIEISKKPATWPMRLFPPHSSCLG